MAPTRSRLDAVLTAVLAGCALVVTGLLVKRELSRPSAQAVDRPSPQYRADWQSFLDPGKSLGVPGGRIRIVEFLDFQCPYCREFTFVLDSVMRLYPSDVYVDVRNFPLTMHQHAAKAALAAECAEEQRAFRRFYSRAFSRPDSEWFGSADALAESLDIPDASAFRLCMSTEVAAANVRRDSLAGVRLGLTGTPLVMVNGWVFSGTPSTGELMDLVRSKHLLSSRASGP